MKPGIKKFISRALLVAITAAITFVLTASFYMKQIYPQIYLKQLIDDNFYGDVSTEQLNEGALRGMMESLDDKYSIYIGSDYGLDNHMNQITGEFVGIGVEIQQDEHGVVLTKIFKGSPAEKAGIQAGDALIKVDDKIIEELPGSVADAVRGEEGTTVKITIKRGEEELEFNVTREKVTVPSVTSKKIGDVGYIIVDSFVSETDEEFKAALEEYNNLDGIIIDLRNNGGGELETTVNMLNMIIDEGRLIKIKYKNSELEYEAEGRAIYHGKIIVLTNSNSASASEFFSAAVKENERGELVGTKTYGKGSVQTVFQLPNNTGVHMTIGRFYSPEGNEINQIGVTPHYEVELPEEYKNLSVEAIPEGEDLQLQKALEIINK